MNEQFLIDSTIPYLESFLKEEQSFDPFAMIMDKEGVVNIISSNIEDEYPTSEYLINLYEQGIKEEYRKIRTKYVLAVICIDAFVNSGTNKQNAVEFRLINPLAEKRLYLKYTIRNNYIYWDKLNS
ncbi:hypothetical protein M2451_003548 [Dysgonomonas sp. PFB1-18]|uniref:hypothetical protein n=1 Tax=unclassified Dysgonomonas TaxID=2630389 RepID=UPI002475B630|nr:MULTISPECIES: hypothetical protein [unclassified Dysgonomonas]MDH6310685.1 hypothetical protein [Dysgonomonas sp. PF1-14]MDH6340536.1 hypothetical protein [Dysgonomonas sp. PF1-16]MDH6382208.1 hypothetical protein [Dysgonomonas sp. PFB1-18]MDH6399551.1 hypothetical protein [Dysgonomonas sp. PF1-23]